jgi:hypothetical protein
MRRDGERRREPKEQRKRLARGGLGRVRDRATVPTCGARSLAVTAHARGTAPGRTGCDQRPPTSSLPSALPVWPRGRWMTRCGPQLARPGAGAVSSGDWIGGARAFCFSTAVMLDGPDLVRAATAFSQISAARCFSFSVCCLASFCTRKFLLY